MTQVVQAKSSGFAHVYPCEEGGVWWESLTPEMWERLKPYEGQELEVDEILRIAGGEK